MRRKNINLEPQQIDSRNWFYDGKVNFILVHEVVDKNGDYIQTDQIKVSVKQLSDFIAELK